MSVCNGGYSWGKANTTIAPFAGIFPVPALCAIPSGRSMAALPAARSVTIGSCDRTWVLGLEGDIHWHRRTLVDITDDSRVTLPAPFPTALRRPRPRLQCNRTQTASALPTICRGSRTLRGRAGFLADPQTRVAVCYGRFGVSASSTRPRKRTTPIPVSTPGLAGTTPLVRRSSSVGPSASSSHTRAGWTAGAGVERELSPQLVRQARISLRGFRIEELSSAGTAERRPTSAIHDNILRAGINYRFRRTGGRALLRSVPIELNEKARHCAGLFCCF